jgi:hypothetical protein
MGGNVLAGLRDLVGALVTSGTLVIWLAKVESCKLTSCREVQAARDNNPNRHNTCTKTNMFEENFFGKSTDVILSLGRLTDHAIIAPLCWIQAH